MPILVFGEDYSMYHICNFQTFCFEVEDDYQVFYNHFLYFIDKFSYASSDDGEFHCKR